jgi:hypothetical protein
LSATGASLRAIFWVDCTISIAGCSFRNGQAFLPLKDPDLIAIFGGADRRETQPITYIGGKRPPMLLAPVPVPPMPANPAFR